MPSTGSMPRCLVTDTVAYDVPVAVADRPQLRAGLDELVFELGLTNATQIAISWKTSIPTMSAM